MDEAKIGMMSAENMGRETLRFVRRAMSNPVYAKKIKVMAKELEDKQRKENDMRNVEICAECEDKILGGKLK